MGATIGTQEFTCNYVGAKVTERSSEVLLLAKIAESQPQADYSALTHDLSSRWRFMARTTPQVGELFLPLENVIRCTLLPLLAGTSPALHDLFTSPPRWGGLGIFNPSEQCDHEYSASVQITEPLAQCIGYHQNVNYFGVKMEQIIRKSGIQSARQSHYSTVSSSIRANLNHFLYLAVDLATTKGASSWLSVLPLAKHGFVLHKLALHDALALHCGWPLSRTPSHCACGTCSIRALLHY